MRSLEPAGGACAAPFAAGWVVVSVADTAANYRDDRLKYPRTSCLRDAPSAATNERPWAATPTSWSVGRVSPASLSPGSWPVREPESWSWTATTSASDRPRRARRDPPDVRRPGHPHAARHDTHGAAVDVFDVRLPNAVRAALRAMRCRIRDGQGRRAHRHDRPHRPRRSDRAARDRLHGVAAGARIPWLPAAGRPALARARGAPWRRLR